MSVVAARYAAPAAAAVSPPRMVSLSFMIPSLQPLKRGQSAAGMPIISAITHGQGDGVVVANVHLPALDGAIDQGLRQEPYARLHLRDDARRERLGDEGAQLRVARRVVEDEPYSSGWPPGGAARLLHVSWSWRARRTPG